MNNIKQVKIDNVNYDITASNLIVTPNESDKTYLLAINEQPEGECETSVVVIDFNLKNGSGAGSIEQTNAIAAGENSVAFGVNQSKKIGDDYNLALSLTKGYNNTKWYNTDEEGSGATEDLVPIEPLTEPEYYKDGTTEITSVHDITFTTTGAHGINSYSEGNDTLALGDYTHTEGYKTYAAAMGSHAEGNMNVVFGVDSHSEGARNISIGQASHTEGMRNTAHGKGSHIEGFKNQTGRKSTWSHVEGEKNLIKGMASHGEGGGNIIFDDIEVIENEDGTITEKNNIAYSHIEGYNNKINASKAHAEGEGNIVNGTSAHAEGKNTEANAKQSHTEGLGTIANGQYSHVQGMYNIPASSGFADIVGNGKTADTRSNAYTLKWTGDGHYAGNVYVNSTWDAATGKTTGGEKLTTHADVWEAINTLNIQNGIASGAIQQVGAQATVRGAAAFNTSTASGKYSHAEGKNTSAQGEAAHAEGANTFAIGGAAHAEGGGSTTASGLYSHAEGQGIFATSKAQHAQGKFNIEDAADVYAHIVGGGSGNGDRRNIHTVAWSGEGWFQGDVYVGSTSGKYQDEGSKKLATVEYVDNHVAVISEDYILSLFA